jgi:hypothetical protein
MGRFLGWFSIGLGLLELCAPRRITRSLGMKGSEALVRSYGAREIGSGILALSVDRQAGLWSRVAGDGLDVATLVTAFRADNPKRHNVGLALAMVLGITLLDVLGAQAFCCHRPTRRQLRHAVPRPASRRSQPRWPAVSRRPTRRRYSPPPAPRFGRPARAAEQTGNAANAQDRRSVWVWWVSRSPPPPEWRL